MFRLNIYQMIVTQTNPQTPTPPPPSSKSKLRKVGFCLAILIIFGTLGFVTYYFGARKPHVPKRHNLYATFDESPAHKKLISSLNKAQFSILNGKKDDGVFQFAEHLANQWVKKGRNVIVQGFTANQFVLIKISKDIVQQVNSQLSNKLNNTDWIFVSLNGELIPEQNIKQISQIYPKSKIVIVTTNSNQKINKTFKSFQYPKLDSKQLLKSITKSYKVKQNVADILTEYYDTHQELFTELNPQKFDPKEHLGENFKPVDNLNKQEAAILTQLCQKGAKKNKKIKQLPSLAAYGVIFVQDKHIWQNEDTLLNYQLNTGSNCINKFATQAQLKAYEQRKQKQEQQRKAKQQEQKRQQQLKKAEEQKKLQEEQKKQEQLQKKKQQAQKAKESSGKAKKQKAPASKKKQAAAPASKKK